MIRNLLFMAALVLSACAGVTISENPSVETGAERMISENLNELQGRSVGLVMNPTARVNGVHVLDTLLSLDVKIAALYAPEHGFRGNFGAGERISDGIDEETGLRVFSLYGQTRKPTSEMLSGIDLLIFDMQDVGARFYTYLSTMGLVMEAAAENDVEVWILDRPNPAGGNYVSGWMLEEKHTSFVGAYPIPIAHGMTLGELAHMIVGEGWMSTQKPLRYRVIEMQNWTRDTFWPQTGLEWIPPSPNLPTFEHAFVYLGTCLIEGTTMSEGRGTDNPFLMFGAPDLSIPNSIVARLSDRYSLEMKDTVFTPVEIPGRALRPKHEGRQVRGLAIRVGDVSYAQKDPVAFGHELLREALLHSDSSTTNNFLYRLAGTDRIMEFLSSTDDPAELWEEEVEAFKVRRKPYLIY